MTTIPEEAVKAVIGVPVSGPYLSKAEAVEIIEAALPFLSALEPSAARELALEEVVETLEYVDRMFRLDLSKYIDWDGDDFNQAIFDTHQRVKKALRALSSPDHADAGKVEGDGWPTGEYEVDYEVICNGEWVAGSTDLNDAKHYAAVYSHDGEIEIVEARTYRRPLPSAPASEGAE